MKAVSGKELCRALERAGWSCTHIRGSHHYYEKSGYRTVCVPVPANRTLKRGTGLAVTRLEPSPHEVLSCSSSRSLLQYSLA